jgi:hypothetical protein
MLFAWVLDDGQIFILEQLPPVPYGRVIQLAP